MGKTTHWDVSRQSGDTYLRKPLQGQTNIKTRNQEQGIESFPHPRADQPRWKPSDMAEHLLDALCHKNIKSR